MSKRSQIFLNNIILASEDENCIDKWVLALNYFITNISNS